MYESIVIKIGRATFLAIYSQTHLVTLCGNHSVTFCQRNAHK
jgi:hypothetical protein